MIPHDFPHDFPGWVGVGQKIFPLVGLLSDFWEVGERIFSPPKKHLSPPKWGFWWGFDQAFLRLGLKHEPCVSFLNKQYGKTKCKNNNIYI